MYVCVEGFEFDVLILQTGIRLCDEHSRNANILIFSSFFVKETTSSVVPSLNRRQRCVKRFQWYHITLYFF